MESVSADGKTTKYGPYTWMSYNECAALRDAIGSSIENDNLAPPNAADGVRVRWMGAAVLSEFSALMCSTIVLSTCCSTVSSGCSRRTATSG